MADAIAWRPLVYDVINLKNKKL